MATLDSILDQSKKDKKINDRDATALGFHSKILEYLDNFEAQSITKLPSLWRSDNIVLRVGTSGGDFVFKYVNDIEAAREVEHVGALRKAYVGFLPKVFCREGQAYLMEHVPGNDFFSAARAAQGHDISGLLGRGGAAIGDVLSKYRLERTSASGDAQIRKTLHHYHAKCMKTLGLKNFEDGAIAVHLPKWSTTLREYPGQISHNDLNAANVIFSENGSVRAIDPEFDPGAVNDPARDIGRYAASVYFNTYDYFGNDKPLAEKHLRAFLKGVESSFTPVDGMFWPRTMFYIAQSAIAFANFNAKTPGVQRAYYDAGRSMFDTCWTEYKGPDPIIHRTSKSFRPIRGDADASASV